MNTKDHVFIIYDFGMIKEVVVEYMNIDLVFHYKTLFIGGVKKRKRSKGKKFLGGDDVVLVGEIWAWYLFKCSI